MKIVIFGCNGYIGRHLCRYMQTRGHYIIGYDIAESTEIDKIEYHYLNILNTDAVNEIDFNVDFVLFFSGKTGTLNGFREYKDFIEINEIGLLNVLTSMRLKNSNARFIFPSTRLVYRGDQNNKLSEDAPKEFKTIYSLNKWNGENLISLFQQYFNLKYTIFRIGVPYGNIINSKYSYGIIGVFYENAIKNNCIELYGGGQQRRTFTHVNDICDQIYCSFFISDCENQIFNVVGENLSLLDVANYFNDKYKNGIIFKEFDEMNSKIESGDTVFDSSKLQKTINFVLSHNLKECV